MKYNANEAIINNKRMRPKIGLDLEIEMKEDRREAVEPNVLDVVVLRQSGS